MNNDGSKLRETMGRHLDGLQPGTPIEHIRKRAHRGRLLMATSLVVLIALVGASGAFMLERFADDEADRVVGPGPTDVSGQIVFSRFSNDASGGIMVMNGDGTGVRQVVDGGSYAIDKPAWSPDGTKIAFHGFFGEAANEDGGLFVINDDGSGLKLLELGGGQPTWSPDGNEIAFNTGGSLRVIRADGEKSRSLVEHKQGSSNAEFPDWSPDGSKILFSSDGIWIVDSDGSNLHRLQEHVIDNRPVHPTWSPDGSQIAFTAYTGDGPTGNIDVVNVDGTERHTVGQGVDPTWSPDGTRIAFEAIDGGASHIYSVRADGTDLQQLTSGPDSDHSPDWVASPAEWTPITTIDELQRELVVYGPSYRAFAVWNEGDPLVLSALVPHMEGERALFCTTSQQFGGPHGEKFDVRGYYYGGPAQHGLDRYESQVQDGVVQFDPQELIQGPARGEGPALEPAGSFCTEDHTEREPGFAATAGGNPALESEFQFEPYPGSPWYGPDGEPVPPKSGIINVIRGIQHCGWESAAMLHLSRPIGTPHQEDPMTYQYLRDPNSVFPVESLLSRFKGNATLFGGSEYTGYRTDFMELWLMPTDDTGAFLMFSDHVEWWPRAEEPFACD